MFTKGYWQELTIKKKIMCFTGFVFFAIALVLLFDFWLVKFTLLDIGGVLGSNSRTNYVMQTLKEESSLFEKYMKNGKEEVRNELKDAIIESKKSLDNLPMDYFSIGAERYARTQSLKNAYEVYEQKRDSLLNRQVNEEYYIQELYEVYDMQKYLVSYAETLTNMAVKSGNDIYISSVPILVCLPYITIVISIIILAGGTYASKMMYHSMVEPVFKIANASKKIANNEFFITDIEVENKDELGEMVHAFNKMKYATSQYITALEEQRKAMDLLHEEELSKLATEKQLDSIHLELLKSQIQPHFLFNTLNVISGMAALEDAQVTEKMIKALSNLFRYNLKTPEEEVVLNKELKVLEDYMYLQKMRFGDRVNYEINCEVDDETVFVPSFMLQPLVENAIIHGISPKEDGGKILVHIWEYKDSINITVNDTGVGMNEEKLEVLRKSLNESPLENKSIGLRNIYHRIKKLYGDFTFDIYSRENEGTLIKIGIRRGKDESINS